MGNLGSDGKPFSQENLERLSRALILLEADCLSVEPAALSVPLLLSWHFQLSAGLERMQPGRYRVQDITFGVSFGMAPPLIAEAVEVLLRESRQVLAAWESEPCADEVLTYATGLHAELIRIHPFWDGNGRLARLVQAWLCWNYGLEAPVYLDRKAYLGGLNRYHHTRDLTLLMDVTRRSLPD